MGIPLRVLILEDHPTDAHLLVEELCQAGMEPEWECVDCEADYLAGLVSMPQIILSDYILSRFDGLRALRLLRERGLDIPFIIVSGTIGEDLAAMAMREGATDYLSKDCRGRLGEAVTRALQRKQPREEKSTEEALQAAQERLQHILAASPAVLFTLAVAEGRIQGMSWISDSVREMLGYSPAEVLGGDWWVRNIHPDDRDRVVEQTRAELFAQDRTQHEYRFRHRDGTYRWTRGEIRLVRNANGQPVEAVGSWSDITERKNLEDQFRQAQKMEAVGRLAGGVAHDFNNLLTVINGYSDLILGTLRPADPLYGMVEQIRKSGERATLLTRQLLTFSRREVSQPVVLDLNVLLLNAESMLGRLIGEDVELVVRPGPDLWRVRADPGQMEQVVMNLAVNAREAMPTGGTFTLGTANVELDANHANSHADAWPGEYVLLAVSDTGCGMDAQTKARIFEPFFSTKGAKGTGLGLAAVFGIIKQASGHIEVHSEPGMGTTFRIYLPRATAEAHRSSGPGTATHGSETILLVEDAERVRTLARLILHRNGYRVLEARDGEEALRLSEQHPGLIHLLVTDVVMPSMSGRQLAERLLTPRPALKVLYMSGYTDDAIVRHGILEAGTPFLQKPFTTEGLARKVREVLDR